MSTYAYTALGPDGRRTSGTLSSDSRAAALAQVTRLGLHPVTIAETAEGARPAPAPAGVRRVPHAAVEAFTRELSSLLAGGIPLARGLSLLQRQASHPAARQLWGAIHDDVVGGMPLADALAKWPRSFSNIYVAMVRAGETGGFLDVVLKQIAEFRTRESELRGRVVVAMVYPALLAVVAIVAMILLMTFFIPKFSVVFQQFGGDLPWLTKTVIAASDAAKRYGLFLLAAAVVGAVAVRRGLATAAGRRSMDSLILRTPMLGQVIARFALVRFARMLGTLIGAGVPLLAALRVARQAIGNQTLSDTVLHAIEQVQRGSSLSASLANSPQLFGPSIVEMVAVAEETGQLDKELLRLAVEYEADLDRKLRLLVSFAEPALLLLMAVMIGTIVIAMLWPVFSLSNLVH